MLPRGRTELTAHIIEVTPGGGNSFGMIPYGYLYYNPRERGSPTREAKPFVPVQLRQSK